MASEPRKVVASLQEARAGLRLDPGVPTLLILSDAPVRGLGAPATAPPAPAAVEGELDLQLVRASGAPAPGLEVELTLPDGSKIAGKTDAGGHFVAKELPKSGACTLQLPDVDEAAPAAFTPAPGAGRQAYQKDLSLPIGKPAVIELPPRVHRGELTGAHFETDKTFLLDSAMPGIRQLVTIYGSFGAASVLVNGHTDTAGPPEHNLALSQERAASIAAFLTDDADAWLANYQGPKGSLQWSAREDNLMVKTLGVPKPKVFNDQSRRELIAAYMATDGTSLPAGTKVSTHGCGETHLAVPTGANVANAENRRVEIYLFDGEVTPPPQTPCPPGGCAEHDQWQAQTLNKVDLDQVLPGLDVQVQDELGQPVDGADVHLAGPTTSDGTTSGGGNVSFPALVPGSYKAIASMDSFSASDGEINIIQGGANLLMTLTLQALADLEVTLTLAAPQTAGQVSAQPAGKSVLGPNAAAPKAKFDRLPTGACTLHATAPFHREKIDSANLSRGQNQVTLALDPFGELKGTIADGSKAVGSALVTLEGPAARSGNSDATGAFDFGNLPLGDYKLKVKKPQFDDFEQAVKITASQSTVKVVLSGLTLDAFVRFEAWNLKTRAFEPIANMPVDAVADHTFGDTTLTVPSVNTDPTGMARLKVTSAKRKAGEAIDLKFVARPKRVIGGVQFPDSWRTKGWLATDNTQGMRSDFKGATLGSAAAPLTFRVGLDLHLKVTYQNAGTFNAVEGTEIDIDDVGKFALDKLGEVHLLTFAIDGGDDVLVEVTGKIENKPINLKKASFNFDDAHIWRTTFGKNQRTSIGTQAAPQIVDGLGQRAGAMYIFKVLSEWSQFLTHVTGNDWDGIDNLDINPSSLSGTAYSFPIGTLNIPPSDWLNRGTISHELSHQVMWKLADISTAGIIGKFLTGKLHLTHTENLLTDDESHPLIEGWAEFIEVIFTGTQYVVSLLTKDPDKAGTIPLGPPPANQGEHCEGAFANALFHNFINQIAGLVIPESNDGNALMPWMDQPGPRAKWKSMIWDVLKDMKSASPFSTRSFLVAMQKRNLATWHTILPNLHRFNLMMERPSILAITPDPAAAGDVLTFRGAEFEDPGTTVTFDGGAAGAVTVTSSTSLQVTMPGGAAGKVNVVVKTSAGASTPRAMTRK